ncbi:hypothetical protein LINGRAHAP2_LOCUS4303 [Linum grandiflorum]
MFFKEWFNRSVTEEVQVFGLSKLIRSEFHPEFEGLKDPKESDAPKGRPRKKGDRSRPFLVRA